MIELTADVSEFLLGHDVDFLLFQNFKQAVFRIWTGLSRGTLVSLIGLLRDEDPDGFHWIGLDNGLRRGDWQVFIGIGFKVFIGAGSGYSSELDRGFSV
jgi:hypothetical protein